MYHVDTVKKNEAELKQFEASGIILPERYSDVFMALSSQLDI